MKGEEEMVKWCDRLGDKDIGRSWNGKSRLTWAYGQLYMAQIANRYGQPRTKIRVTT